MKRILALDPAQACGFAHTNGARGTWLLGKGDKRLVALRNQLLKADDEWGVGFIAYEDAGFGSLRARDQSYANELIGIIKHVCAELRIENIAYKPSSIKKFATQNGFAKKAQMMRACETILKIKPRDDNEADALWILAMAKIGYVPPVAKKKVTLRSVTKAKRLF